MAQPLGRRWYPPVRAVAEFVAALVLLILTAPVMGLAAVIVRMTSPGRAFYFQTRVGRNGRPYTMYKIRSMYHDCEMLSGPCWASRRDPHYSRRPRITGHSH